MKLTPTEERTLIDYVNQSIKSGKETRLLIEIESRSISTDVKISSIPEDVYLQTFGKQSIIDWDNYNF
jgi:hypothetical protein